MLDHYKKIYGLIGYPLGHSSSRTFFNEKFAAENIDAEYVNFEIPAITDLKKVVKDNPTLSGLNVTIPYKEQVIPFLDDLDKDAAAIGAVNVIKVIRDDKGRISRLKGFNSDVIGFMESIRALLKPSHRKALVLGTGGAAKAVSHGLKQLGVEPVYVSRSAGEGRITYADLTPEVMAEHTVVVNATPLGMYPNVDACPDIPYDLVSKYHLCYDVLYNPTNTLFMKKCAANGAVVKNGTEMLLMQAFAAWDIWNRKAYPSMGLRK